MCYLSPFFGGAYSLSAKKEKRKKKWAKRRTEHGYVNAKIYGLYRLSLDLAMIYV